MGREENSHHATSLSFFLGSSRVTGLGICVILPPTYWGRKLCQNELMFTGKGCFSSLSVFLCPCSRDSYSEEHVVFLRKWNKSLLEGYTPPETPMYTHPSTGFLPFKQNRTRNWRSLIWLPCGSHLSDW